MPTSVIIYICILDNRDQTILHIRCLFDYGNELIAQYKYANGADDVIIKYSN